MFSSGMPGIIPVMNVDGNNDNGFGNGGGWWCWIILFALFGWGGNGFGWGSRNNGCGSCCETAQFTEAAVQRGFDNQSVMNKLNGIEQGICSLGYDQLAQMNGIQNAVMQTGWNIQQSINADTIANMQNTNALSRQLGDCCCENRMAVAQLRYDDATNTCSIVNAIKDASQAQIQNCNANYRQMHDELIQMQMEAKNETIANLRQALNNCDRDAALQGTANYIINTVRPTTQPAYLTCNPNTGMVFPCGTNWQNNNCGCGCGNNGNCCC